MQKSDFRDKEIYMEYSKQTGSSSRQKTCIRWILIHLNSEFNAMQSWKWCEIYKSVWLQ